MFFKASKAYLMDLVKKYDMSDLNCFISKPIAIEELVKRINKIITMDAG